MPSLMGPPMREAASVHVAAPPSQVIPLLGRPGFLRALDDRLPSVDQLKVSVGKDRVEVREQDGHVHLAFRIKAEGTGAKVSALETVHPKDPLEAGLHALFPKRQHDALQRELDRLKGLVEAVAQSR